MFVQADNLVAMIRTICQAAGSDEREALMVARNLVEANLTGHDSHGVGLIPTYIPTALKGHMSIGQHASLISENGPILVVDGNMGYGQVIGHEAMAMGLERVAELGVAVVALRNCYHLGRIGAWGEICAGAGYISIHYVNAHGHRALVAPFGGTDARYTTNPYCTAIPATDQNPPFILDMATSRIAMGKVRVAFNKGEEVVPGALIGPDGGPTRDPGVMFREPSGAILPIGLHKGYGLALVCELLAGGLTGGGVFLPERVDQDSIVNNMLTVMIDPAAVGDAAAFAREIDDLTAHVKQSPPGPGVDEVMVPGDPERKSRAERNVTGIPIDERTWQELIETAAMVGISLDEMNRLVAA